MKIIQSDAVIAEALPPKGVPTKDVPAKQATKPAAFHSLLNQFDRLHSKPSVGLPSKKMDEKPDAKAAPDVLGGLGDLVDTPAEAVDAKANAPKALAEPAAPVLWAQMLMAQGTPAEPAQAPLVAQMGDTQMAATPMVPSSVVNTTAVSNPVPAPAVPVSGNWQSPSNPGTVQKATVADVLQPDVVKPDASVLPSAGQQEREGHGASKAPSWIADGAGVAMTATPQKPSSQQGKLMANELPRQGLTPEVLVAASQSPSLEVFQQDHKRSAVSSKGGFESGQTLYSSQGLDMTSHANQAAVSLGVSASTPVDAAPETAVANQVAAWVSQNIQSAELKLDALGRDPVEVSISLVGNEATVEFRCDTPETREILNRATSQLDTMLRSEGLVLSGVSVGTSSQQPSGDKAPSQRQAGIERLGRAGAAAKADIPAQTRNLVQNVRVPDGTVDLFV